MPSTPHHHDGVIVGIDAIDQGKRGGTTIIVSSTPPPADSARPPDNSMRMLPSRLTSPLNPATDTVFSDLREAADKGFTDAATEATAHNRRIDLLLADHRTATAKLLKENSASMLAMIRRELHTARELRTANRTAGVPVDTSTATPAINHPSSLENTRRSIAVEEANRINDSRRDVNIGVSQHGEVNATLRLNSPARLKPPPANSTPAQPDAVDLMDEAGMFTAYERGGSAASTTTESPPVLKPPPTDAPGRHEQPNLVDDAGILSAYEREGGADSRAHEITNSGEDVELEDTHRRLAVQMADLSAKYQAEAAAHMKAANARTAPGSDDTAVSDPPVIPPNSTRVLPSRLPFTDATTSQGSPTDAPTTTGITTTPTVNHLSSLQNNSKSIAVGGATGIINSGRDVEFGVHQNGENTSKNLQLDSPAGLNPGMLEAYKQEGSADSSDLLRENPTHTPSPSSSLATPPSRGERIPQSEMPRPPPPPPPPPPKKNDWQLLSRQFCQQQGTTPTNTKSAEAWGIALDSALYSLNTLQDKEAKHSESLQALQHGQESLENGQQSLLGRVNDLLQQLDGRTTTDSSHFEQYKMGLDDVRTTTEITNAQFTANLDALTKSMVDYQKVTNTALEDASITASSPIQQTATADAMPTDPTTPTRMSSAQTDAPTNATRFPVLWSNKLERESISNPSHHVAQYPSTPSTITNAIYDDMTDDILRNGTASVGQMQAQTNNTVDRHTDAAIQIQRWFRGVHVQLPPTPLPSDQFHLLPTPSLPLIAMDTDTTTTNCGLGVIPLQINPFSAIETFSYGASITPTSTLTWLTLASFVNLAPTMKTFSFAEALSWIKTAGITNADPTFSTFSIVEALSWLMKATFANSAFATTTFSIVEALSWLMKANYNTFHHANSPTTRAPPYAPPRISITIR